MKKKTKEKIIFEIIGRVTALLLLSATYTGIFVYGIFLKIGG